MTFQTIDIELPADILLTINETESGLKNLIKVSLAIQLFTQSKITLGKAAEIAGMPRLHFETLLSKNQISISSLDLEDVLNDVEKLK